jgi:hypothetical protein
MGMQDKTRIGKTMRQPFRNWYSNSSLQTYWWDGPHIRGAENPAGVIAACFNNFPHNFGVTLTAPTINYFHCACLIFQTTSDFKKSFWFYSGDTDSFLTPNLL